ncbi:ribonuclease H1-like isoform X1 [Portunus trituberculatus]|uniref:ribonuclease H1-like isoform X1 n=1 Tax=Portunus trituberculatus TaxID=210409 RepID=UPI001E1CE283|nr:ribonuclease H1-like isoform X1 [Portunus trituberculatus]
MTRPSLSRVFAALQLGIARKKMPFYAVARGNKPGIYQTWAECQESINGYARARYKKFATEAEAKEFVQENSLTCPTVDRRETSKKAEDNGAPPSSRTHNEGSLSPTLLEMKTSMKCLQKDLSELRTRFESYIQDRSGTARSKPLPPSSAPVQKRKHESESEEEGDEDRPSSSKKLNAEGKEGDKTKFKVDSDGFLIVYTDGSCWMNGKQGAKAGMGVFFGQDHPLNVAEPIKGRPTNNNAEIQAATCALELAKSAGFSKVAVHTDSQFMIDCASSWMKNWKKKGWVKSDGQPVKNKEELMVLDSAMDDLAVKWVHVKAHAGHEGNEEADKLARQGGKQYKSEA